MKICQLTNSTEKQAVTRSILEALPEWFGIPEAREDYITESGDKQFFCAYDADKPVGFLYLKETGTATVELYVMGVLKEHHRQGIGRELFQQAREAAGKSGYSFMQVKTVQMGRYAEYDSTNRFYLSLGFQEFEVFPTQKRILLTRPLMKKSTKNRKNLLTTQISYAILYQNAAEDSRCRKA